MSYIHELTVSIESVTADRRRLKAGITSWRFELDESHRSRREAEKRNNRLKMEVDRLTHEQRCEVHRGRENDKNANNVNQSLRAEIRQLSIQLVTAHSVGQRPIAMLQAKLNDTERHQV